MIGSCSVPMGLRSDIYHLYTSFRIYLYSSILLLSHVGVFLSVSKVLQLLFLCHIFPSDYVSPAPLHLVTLGVYIVLLFSSLFLSDE